jgi:isoamylase
MTRLRNPLLLAFAALALAGPAARLGAAAVGANHPASGAYSPVNQASWGTSTWPLGSAFTAGPGSTLEVAVYSANATNIVLEIYTADTGADAAYDYTMAKGPDNIWRAAVSNAPAFTLYAFRAWGPNWPFSSSWARGNSTAGFITDCDSQGNRFNPNKVLFDPYTRELSHNTFTQAMHAAGEDYAMYTSGGTNISPGQTYKGPLSSGAAIDCRNVDTGHWAPKAVAFVDTTPTGPKPGLSQKDAIIYETHLKGLTAHPSSVSLTALLSPYSGFQDAANVPDGLRGTYAGAAYMAGYLKDLGFNTVEFLPVQETDNATDSTTAPTTSGGGYWCYFTYGYFAPDRRFASDQSLGGPTREFKAMVAAFHNAGIEVYLDVVYNHSGEGGVWDASTAAQAELTFFRGLDNQSYYTLVSGTPQFYWVSTGVGTNVNAGSAPVRQLILDSLTYWANTMGVDGFRFDEAAELGRSGSSNFSGTAPLLVSIASLASSDGFKIVAEPWDGNDGGEIGNFPAGWACWNGNYRDSVRMFMTGNLTGYVSGAGGLGYADAFYGDYAKMNAEGGPQKSVNYVVCHDGFNMTDLVSYGTPPSSLVWPFGPEAEGGADNSSSWGGNQTLRRQAIRDFWTYQVLSRGLPMMVWGDEFGRTVNGNNNSYNIDSVATWNNYNMIGTNSPDTVPTGDTTGGTMGYDNNLGTFAGSLNGNFAFLQYLLHLRGAHPAFRQQDFTSESITFANADGSTGFTQGLTPSFEIYVHGSQVGDDDFMVLCNVSAMSVTFAVPAPPSNTHWARIIDTNSASEGAINSWTRSAASTVSGTSPVGGQSIVVLEAVAQLPAISSQPQSVVVSAGQNATFSVAAAGVGSLGYQWQVLATGGSSWSVLSDGDGFSGTATAALTVTGVAASMSGDQFRAVVSNSNGSVTSSAASLYVNTGSSSARLINISTRAQVGTGGNILIPGFVVGGSGTETLLIRADGPSLAAFGVGGALSEPSLSVTNSAGAVVASNTGWGTNPNPSQIASIAAQVGAFPLASGSADCAVVVSLPAGAYTVQISGVGNTTGVALAEVYEVASSGTRLINIATRAQVGTGGNILIPGFVIGGSGTEELLVRGDGPSLTAFGVGGALAEPSLSVTNSEGTSIATNTGWGTNSNSAQIASIGASVGAFSLAPGSADSALVVDLQAGAYTMQISGVGNTTGVALAEVYEVP